MSDSKKTLITDYIKEFAIESPSRFHWSYVDIYSRALFSTIATLKASRNVSINYLSNSNKILTGHSSLFKLIGIRFLNTAKESHRLEILLPSMVPSENPIFINTFTEVISGIYQDMLETMTKSQVDKTMSKVNLVYDASLVYCWHFINMAYNNNLVDKVIEELYLLKEIEAFKNRKGE